MVNSTGGGGACDGLVLKREAAEEESTHRGLGVGAVGYQRLFFGALRARGEVRRPARDMRFPAFRARVDRSGGGACSADDSPPPESSRSRSW